MRDVRVAVQRNAVVGDPAPHPYADGGDLLLGAVAARDPDTDPARTAFSADPEMGEGRDQPFLEITNIAAQICAPAPLQIEHHVSAPLARSVIGELPAAAGLENGKPLWVEQMLGPGAGAGGVKRRVLQQPDQLRRMTGSDACDPPLHGLYRVRVAYGV